MLHTVLNGLKTETQHQNHKIFSDTRIPLDAKHSLSKPLTMKYQLRDFRLLLACCRQITVNIFQVEAYLSQFKINISELLANSDDHILYFMDYLRNYQSLDRMNESV